MFKFNKKINLSHALVSALSMYLGAALVTNNTTHQILFAVLGFLGGSLNDVMAFKRNEKLFKKLNKKSGGV